MVWESEAAAGAFCGSEAFQRMAQRLGIQPNIVAQLPGRDRAEVTRGASMSLKA